MGKLLLSFIVFLLGSPVFAQTKITLKSADGKLIFLFRLLKENPVYQLIYNGKTLVNDSGLGLDFKETGAFGPGLKLGKPVFTSVDENYELVVGKTKKYPPCTPASCHSAPGNDWCQKKNIPGGKGF